MNKTDPRFVVNDLVKVANNDNDEFLVRELRPENWVILYNKPQDKYTCVKYGTIVHKVCRLTIEESKSHLGL